MGKHQAELLEVLNDRINPYPQRVSARLRRYLQNSRFAIRKTAISYMDIATPSTTLKSATALIAKTQT